MTDQEILGLIACPKTIIDKDPAQGYREDNLHRRCDLQLVANTDAAAAFRVFIRQNLAFIENFSIGLRYHTNQPNSGAITLIRYNGPHGEVAKAPDGHYNKSHIHRITAEEIAAGFTQPQEKHREITERYAVLAQAIGVFFRDIAAGNYAQYFPELRQGSLFNGHRQP